MGCATTPAVLSRLGTFGILLVSVSWDIVFGYFWISTRPHGQATTRSWVSVKKYIDGLDSVNFDNLVKSYWYKKILKGIHFQDLKNVYKVVTADKAWISVHEP